MRDWTPQKGLITCLAYTPPWVSPSYFCQDDKIQTLWLYYNLFSDLKSGSDLETWKLYFFVKTGQELMNCGVYELLRTSDVLSLPAVRCVSLELYYQSQRAESCLLNFDRGNASPICEVFISCLSLSQFGLYRHELFLSIVCRISLRQEKKKP